MYNANENKLRASEIVISIMVKIIAFSGIFYLCTMFGLPIALTASLILFVFALYVTLSNFKAFHRPKKILCIGVTIAISTFDTDYILIKSEKLQAVKRHYSKLSILLKIEITCMGG